jgi:signal transduction histidine kinase
MRIITRDQRLVARAYWLVSHRWLAIIAVAALSWLGTNLFDVNISPIPLYLITLGLIIENLITLGLLEHIKKKRQHDLLNSTRLVIHFQIALDLLFLTAILHFTGGIENPFFLIYFLHMVISSILLSRTGAFLQTSLALILFGMLVYAEYAGILPHYCMCIDNLPNHELYLDKYYVLRVYCVFVMTSYVLVYLTTSIGHRLRNQEDKLTHAITQLEKNDQIKNEYVLRITHDIKGHLAAIQTNLSVLTSGIFGKPEGKQKEFIERAYNRTEKLTNFSRKLLALTRIKLQNKVEKKEFSLINVIEKSINDLRDDAREKGIAVKTELDEKAELIVGNQISFEEVLHNLIGNAIKYSKEGGLVNIKLVDRAHKIRLEVADEGVGIPNKEMKQIFDEFYRASNVRSAAFEGSGVGLSLVKVIVLRHGGRIWAENIREGGARFIVELPKETNNG